jgi:hypothetical protein
MTPRPSAGVKRNDRRKTKTERGSTTRSEGEMKLIVMVMQRTQEDEKRLMGRMEMVRRERRLKKSLMPVWSARNKRGSNRLD